MRILEVKELKTYFYSFEGVVKAVDGVSFDIGQERSLGIAGESGCGKTTLGLSLVRLVPPPGRIVSGKILFDGEDILQKTEPEMRKMRGKKIAVVLQGAMNALNPVLRIKDIIMEPLRIHEKISKEQAMERIGNVLELVGIERSRADEYPHEFSGGMKQRVIIAMALSLNPKLMILDEPATALDVIMQRQVLEFMKDLRRKVHLSSILISHDLSIMSELCEEILIIYGGKAMERAETETIIEKPMNPYTQGLISAFPRIRGERTRIEAIPGNPPYLINPPPGCRFHPRCKYAKEICLGKEPELREIEKGHYVACHLYNR